MEKEKRNKKAEIVEKMCSARYANNVNKYFPLTV